MRSMKVCQAVCHKVPSTRRHTAAAAALGDTVITVPRPANVNRLPVVTNTGMQLGSCAAATSPESVVASLKYIWSALCLFKSPAVSAARTFEAFLVEASILKKPMKVSVMSYVDGELQKLADCLSVTSFGQLRFTQVESESPDADCEANAVISRLLDHQSLSYLKGLDLKLAGRIGDNWIILSHKIPDANITELGLVVPKDSVRVVTLKFGDMFVPTVLRLDPGESLYDSLKSCCDWHAWPAVRACIESPALRPDNVIEMTGANLLLSQFRVNDLTLLQAT
jgi:hypothetical protein